MDIGGLPVQSGSENIDRASAASLYSIIELNASNIANIPDGSIVFAMENEKEKFDEDFSNGSELDDHVDPDIEMKANAKLVKRLKPPVIFRCEMCLTEFENAKMLTEHLDKHDFQYSCNTCGENFKLTLDFIDHVRKHSIDKFYKCPLCKFEVEKRTKMTLHLQSRHDQFKKYRCEICQKGINVYTHFVEHKFTHTNEKPFKCDKCDSSFAQNVSLHSHYARMHVENPISCDVCQKICRNKIDLRSHKTCHSRKSAVCEKCGKCLSSKDKLRLHERTHTGEKPYLCKYCPKSFKTSSYRSDHERTHTGDKPHICPICSKSFTQRTTMKIHEASHRTDKPFQCNVCAKRFKVKILRNSHEKKCTAAPQVNGEVGYNDGIDQNVLHEDVLVNHEQYGTLTSQGLQDLNNVNEPEQLPWNQAYSYGYNYYNSWLVFNTSTIAQVGTNFVPSNSHAQLEMSHQSHQSHQMNVQ